MGFEVDDLDIQFDDGKATITGAVDDNATRERVILTVGNTDGVGQVDDQLRVKTHVELAAEEVEPADRRRPSSTPWCRATHSRRSPRSSTATRCKYPEIFEANKPMLKDPDLIYPGQVLRIPALGGSADDSRWRQPQPEGHSVATSTATSYQLPANSCRRAGDRPRGDRQLRTRNGTRKGPVSTSAARYAYWRSGGLAVWGLGSTAQARQDARRGGSGFHPGPSPPTSSARPAAGRRRCREWRTGRCPSRARRRWPS